MIQVKAMKNRVINTTNIEMMNRIAPAMMGAMCCGVCMMPAREVWSAVLVERTI